MIRRFALGAATLLCAAVSAVPTMAEPLKIAIANYGEHPALARVIKGFRDELAASGYVDGKDVVFTEDHVNFDATLLPQMIAKIEATGPNLVLAITTPVAQSVKNSMGDMGIPLVFASVTDPVTAGLVPSWSQGDTNMSGATDAIDIDATLAFARKLFPDARVIGVPFNPGEANDVATLEQFKADAAKNGFKVAEVGIDNTSEIAPRIAALAGKADVIYGPASNMIQPAIAAVAAAANEARIPLINVNELPVVDGYAPAGFTVSYEKIGHLAGKIAVRALKGEALKDIPPSRPSYEDHIPVISRKGMEAIGKAIPAGFENCNCIVN